MTEKKKGFRASGEGRIKEGPLRIERDKKKITLVHDIDKIDLSQEKADCVIFGHTHKPEIAKKDAKLFINPGEAGGWLTNKSTIAILDLTTLTPKLFKI